MIGDFQMEERFKLPVRWYSQSTQPSKQITQRMVVETIGSSLAQLPANTTTRGVLFADYGQRDVTVIGEIQPQAMYFNAETYAFVAAVLDASLLLVRSDLDGLLCRKVFTLQPQRYLQVVLAYKE